MKNLFSMQSTGSPKGITTDGTWVACTNSENTYVNNDLTLFYNSGWIIVNKQNVMIAYAFSFASHPLNIRTDEWIFINFNKHDFRFRLVENTHKTPYEINDIGEDYFMYNASNVIWWRDPTTNEVEHSGAKYKRNQSGKRWCSICKRAISANNFKSQHYRKLHEFNKSIISNTTELYCVFLQYKL